MCISSFKPDIGLTNFRATDVLVEIYELATEVRALSSWCLGRYSFLSLQRLDAICFIAGVLANGLDAVIEGSKLELLVQLDSKLVDFNFGWS